MSKVIREICAAGAVIDVAIRMTLRASKGCRKEKKNKTNEAVQKYNDRLSVKTLARLLNMNFFPGDFHTTLTYAEIMSVEEAKHQLSLFIDRMRREYAKQGKEFYYVAVTEYKNKRIHHHIVMNYIDGSIIDKQWKLGHIWLSTLDRSRNYTELAEYLVKETQQTFRDPENSTKRRWTASRNLKRPIVKREYVSIAQLFDEPKAFNGYQLDKDSVRKFENPITGLEHKEYQMVATEPVPRIKTWRKGKIVNRQEGYIRMAAIEQVSFEDLVSVDTL